METVVGPPENELELHLLTDWGGRDAARTRKAGILSVVFHIAALAGLALLPKSILAPRELQTHTQITPLISPPVEVTQPTPNRGPLQKEIAAESIVPRPRIQIPPSPRSTTRPAAIQPGQPVPPPPPAPVALPEPPKIEAAGAAIQGPRIAGPEVPQPAPQIQPQEKPKLAFETPGAPPSGPRVGPGSLAVPNSSVSEAIRTVVRGGVSGGLTVGDVGPPSTGGIGEGINLPPSPGKAGSNLELLSDPLGVDFRPYLIRILSTVRRNWFAVMPESAKLGHRGKVSIQFSIARNGSVPKLVIVGGSGADALDRAAVAGISASNPFPPLPGEFKGDQIRLQFNFMYNMRTN